MAVRFLRSLPCIRPVSSAASGSAGPPPAASSRSARSCTAYPHNGCKDALNCGPDWTDNWGAGHTRSPRKLGAQRALDEPEARLGQDDEHGNPGDIADHRMPEHIEYRD